MIVEMVCFGMILFKTLYVELYISSLASLCGLCKQFKENVNPYEIFSHTNIEQCCQLRGFPTNVGGIFRGYNYILLFFI